MDHIIPTEEHKVRNRQKNAHNNHKTLPMRNWKSHSNVQSKIDELYEHTTNQHNVIFIVQFIHFAVKKKQTKPRCNIMILFVGTLSSVTIIIECIYIYIYNNTLHTFKCYGLYINKCICIKCKLRCSFAVHRVQYNIYIYIVSIRIRSDKIIVINIIITKRQWI